MTTNLGRNFYDIGGLRTDLRVGTEIETLVSDLIARLNGPFDLIRLGDPDYGYDLSGLSLVSVNPSFFSILEQEIILELKKDTRVESVIVDGTFDVDSETLTLYIHGTTYNDDRSFDFVGTFGTNGYPRWETT